MQFFADADDVDTWMLDTLRLVSSEDVGRDEASVQSLLKKHRDISDELENYSTVIQALHEQAANLGEGVRKSSDLESGDFAHSYPKRKLAFKKVYFGVISLYFSD